jgi:hypothetical protein
MLLLLLPPFERLSQPVLAAVAIFPEAEVEVVAFVSIITMHEALAKASARATTRQESGVRHEAEAVMPGVT